MATDTFISYTIQRHASFFFAINQFDSYFDNSAIVIRKFIDHFHQDQFTASYRLIRSQSSANFI